MMLHGQSSAATHMRSIHEGRGGWMACHGYDLASAGGNQELNEDLRAKADELEKLFAEHMQRVSHDRMTSSQRNNHEELHEREIPMEGSSSGLMLSLEDYHGYGQSEDCRGELYDRYMQKREAKLRKEWGLKRAKKAEINALLDSLERTWAEMKLRFGESTDERDPAPYAHHTAEKLRSFGVRSPKRNIEEHKEESIHSEEQGLQVLPAQFQNSQDNLYNATTIQSKKLLHSRSVSSSITRTSGAPPSSRPATRATNLVPKKQSFPRKENTKPMAAVGKAATHAPSTNFARSKSTNEGTNLMKGIKTQRSQPQRKRTPSLGGLKDVSPLNSDTTSMSRFSKEESDHTLLAKAKKSSEVKPFLKKGSGMGPGAGANLAAWTTSMSSDMLENGEESKELIREEEEEFEKAAVDRIHLRRHHRSYSYSHNALDSDASMDSPTGNEASCNTQSMNTVTAGRTRKKWGDVQQPVLVAHASQQSGKTAAKGFMRLLKFGKKSSKIEESSVNDCVSPSASSIVDYNVEDSHGLPNWSSNDLRKLNLDYSFSAYDSFNENNIYAEEGHRSFAFPHCFEAKEVKQKSDTKWNLNTWRCTL